MSDCVIVQPIAPVGVALLERAGLSVHQAASAALDDFLPHLRCARAVITRDQGFSREAIAQAPLLQVIASHGTGTERIDKAAAAARGIVVVNTPGTNALSVAEHALGLIFACARRICAADLAVRRADWAFRDRSHPVELAGRCLGLVGFGRIAQHLARLAQGIGMTVTAHTVHAGDALQRAGVHRAPDLDALITGADVISLHGLPTDTPLINTARLARLRAGAILVNTARGALIDEIALSRALLEGRLAAAALDVFSTEPLPVDSPLFACPNLILTPHIGGSSRQALERTARQVARRVIEALELPVPQ